jgi:hypothetical protein
VQDGAGGVRFGVVGVDQRPRPCARDGPEPRTAQHGDPVGVAGGRQLAQDHLRVSHGIVGQRMNLRTTGIQQSSTTLMTRGTVSTQWRSALRIAVKRSIDTLKVRA